MLINIDPKTLEHACQCAGRSVHHFDRMGDDLPLRASIIAHARAIEAHEAFRQEVSDAVEAYMFDPQSVTGPATMRHIHRFIIAKPDPLVEAMNDSLDRLGAFDRDEADRLRAAIEKRGGRLVWNND